MMLNTQKYQTDQKLTAVKVYWQWQICQVKQKDSTDQQLPALRVFFRNEIAGPEPSDWPKATM